MLLSDIQSFSCIQYNITGEKGSWKTKMLKKCIKIKVHF